MLFYLVFFSLSLCVVCCLVHTESASDLWFCVLWFFCEVTELYVKMIYQFVRRYGVSACESCCEQEAALIASDGLTYPEVDWVIGNHSDELTPWIPIIAAR